jgi:regulator of RNase E activity RraA
VEYGIAAKVGGIDVVPVDIVFGDRDGVLVVPHALAGEAFDLALRKVEGENKVREAFRQGMSAVEAFDKFGVM